jgi:formate dehydrogenase accessory protein FdhE
MFSRGDNCPMAVSPWQRRIHRAQQLTGQYPFAAEILGFYIHLARFQENLHRQLSVASPRHAPPVSVPAALTSDQLEKLCSSFDSFLSIAEARGPKALAELSRELRVRSQDFWCELLNGAWTAHSPSAQGLLAMAFLQPYAELLRSQAELHAVSTAHALCPFCNRKPGFGVFRQMGDGGARSMVCSFCLAEWDFRRIVCPGCGEENNKNLPVFTASDFDYIRVECCDTCKTYIKSIDLTKNGRAEPLVDELASAPLDLWAHEHGYSKLQCNLLGM